MKSLNLSMKTQNMGDNLIQGKMLSKLKKKGSNQKRFKKKNKRNICIKCNIFTDKP